MLQIILLLLLFVSLLLLLFLLLWIEMTIKHKAAIKSFLNKLFIHKISKSHSILINRRRVWHWEVYIILFSCLVFSVCPRISCLPPHFLNTSWTNCNHLQCVFLNCFRLKSTYRLSDVCPSKYARLPVLQLFCSFVLPRQSVSKKLRYFPWNTTIIVNKLKNVFFLSLAYFYLQVVWSENLPIRSPVGVWYV